MEHIVHAIEDTLVKRSFSCTSFLLKVDTEEIVFPQDRRDQKGGHCNNSAEVIPKESLKHLPSNDEAGSYKADIGCDKCPQYSL
jgi:hypothetical protein